MAFIFLLPSALVSIAILVVYTFRRMRLQNREGSISASQSGESNRIPPKSPPAMASQPGEPIAIIGSGCRFPGESTNPSKLWDLLRQPRDVLKRIPPDRFDPKGFYHPDGMHHGSTEVQESYLLEEDHRLFDATFFNIKPIEASSIDPQQRLLLETVYESVESAGLSMEKMRGSGTAVYVGLMCEEYSDLLIRDVDSLPTYFATGTARSIMSNRISYFFDWHGPSMTIDTACSSSLVAVHEAVQALRHGGGSRVAIAAGANLILGPEPYIAESKLKMLSPGSRSRMWDADADGYARGDGLATVVLKTLSNAIEDGDHIECIIRETGVNQDGRTKGITMPSRTAQVALIRDTYAKAGLDLSKKHERCQFFEAHGTGTPAGDPIEAGAVSHAFFPPEGRSSDVNDVLYVGSVKTVIGHTEGTAGLAGVLKASLALRHAIVPPNMLLNRLHPAVEPFYNNLEIPITAKSWPAVPNGTPRRASVNSFGFGGTNAHAILESYEPTQPSIGELSAKTPVFTPFVFSAASESSLAATLAAYSAYLKANESINLRDLAWTLHSRRSQFPVRATFSGLTNGSLCSKLDAKLEAVRSKAEANIGVRSQVSSSGILGVFTGQGAQWALMGAELIRASEFVRDSIDSLERSLAELPAGDRPLWSLKDELLADASRSRLNEAAISQPLCTAVQIVLVDLLQSAGIDFVAVVGHSSGEIAAAYAAGFISAHDSIRIAYYRGFHAGVACGSDGQKGAMLAVGTSIEDAKEFCELPHFNGRISMAASNSSSSVTLSGDIDAIEEAKDVFDEEKKFARILKVDKAYHSHHMLACSDPYVQSLRACKIKIQQPSDTACLWFSSVRAGETMQLCDDLKDVYWKDNMISPVLLVQAIEGALAEKGPMGIALEVGPHPALQGPASQTIQETSGDSIPYSGLLNRGKNDIEALSAALGFVWIHFGKSAVDFEGYDSLMSSDTGAKLLKNLPTYSWDHDRVFWHESRKSKALRTRDDPVHELLGTRCTDGTEQELRWRNLLLPRELPWLRGHQLQGETVFPAAGYAALALEASRALAGDRPIELIEVQDLVIGRPITFDDNDSGIETLFTLTRTKAEAEDLNVAYASFTYYSALRKEASSMTLISSGRVEVVLGEPSAATLPSRTPPPPEMTDVEADRFYSCLAELGYAYSGPFKALSSMKRKLGVGSGLVSMPPRGDPERAFLVHPAMLDAAFQSLFLAYCWPGDGRLWSLHVPTGIRRIRVNPFLCTSKSDEEVLFPFDSVLGDSSLSAIYGDVDVFAEDGRHANIQVEGVSVVPFSEATASDDLQLFSKTVWDIAAPDGETVAGNDRATTEDYELAKLLERVSYFYLRNLSRVTTHEERARSEWFFQKLFEFADNVYSLVEKGKQPFAETTWEHDKHDEIVAMMDKYSDRIEIRLMRAVGENLPAVVRGQTTILEHMMHNNMLNDYYVLALGLPQYTDFLARAALQVVHRYPHMKILEIGAGTGGATKRILKLLGQSFTSYTFTDISTGFFEKAQQVFKGHEGRMIFKALDCEKDIESQGYSEHSYDLIIASLVLHATSKLEYTMKNVRRLLKPGGYLLMLEVTDNGPIRTGFTMGALPGWWLGGNDGRSLSPCISSAQWNALLARTGFSGVDTITPDLDVLPRPFSVIATQALDERVDLLRRPLSSFSQESEIPELVILGGNTLRTSRLGNEISGLLRRRCGLITQVQSLEEFNVIGVSAMSTVLSLTELDEPIFKSMTSEKLEGLKQLFDQSRNVLWITQGCRADAPYANMTVGLGRSLVLEIPHIRLQFLDIDSSDKADAHMLSETLLRLQITDSWEKEGVQNKILWSTEPEMALENGRILIPRMFPDKIKNDRYNSSRRLITKEASPKLSNISLGYSGASYYLREGSEPASPAQANARGNFVVQVSHSLLSSLKVTSTGYLFIVCGTIAGTGQKVLAMSESQASIIELPEQWLVTCDIPGGREEQFLSLLANELLAQYLLALTSRSKTLLVHEPEPFFASLLAQRASEENVHILYTTVGWEVESVPWVPIHPRASRHTMEAILPENVSVFVDLSTEGSSKIAGSHIAGCLPPLCKLIDVSTLFAKEALARSDSLVDSVPKLLKSAWLRSKIAISELNKSPVANTVALTDVSKENPVKGLSSIIDWTANTTVPVKVEPVDTKISFSQSKTYLLLGLTGGLGQSLCQWMVGQGARYIVLTSRNPKIDPKWLETLEAAGATVKVIPNDITNKESVHNLYEEVCRTLPPVAGVANGAMVLHDTLFGDMDLEKMEKVLKPKVEGSIHLDELFAENNLDFFIFFSSLASVFGNTGQSNYSSANMFMTSLAAQRRKRGLAGSVIDIGAIMGVGYMTREVSQWVLDQLRNSGYMWMSERDFHQMFAEAILAGHPQSTQNPEIVTGLRVVNADEELKTVWTTNPKFQHCVIHQAVDGNKDNGSAVVPIMTQLQAATSQRKAYEILKDSFVSKLQTMLQLGPKDAGDEGRMIELGADELGVDSLVAVEVRSWWLKELHIDMPVLKILGGASVGNLLDYALEKLPEELIPNVSDGVDSTPAQAKNEAKKELLPQPATEDITSSNSPSSLDTDAGGFSPPERDGSAMSSLSVSEEDAQTSMSKKVVQRTERMSFGQARFWFLNYYLDDQTTFNITCSIRLKGALRAADLEKAVHLVAQRHEALRTCFFADEAQQPLQGILESSVLQLEQKKIATEEEVHKEFALMKTHVYSLERGETMRILLLSLSPTSHSLIIGYHHINMDGVSLQILLSHLERAYNRQPLAPKIFQYPTFSIKQREDVLCGRMKEELGFWRKEFPDLPPPLPIAPLSKVNSRRALTRYDFHRIEFKVDPALAERIKEACRKQRVTSFHFHLATFKALLFRFLDTDDLCVGFGDANRTDGNVRESIGFYLNLLPLRFRSKPTQTFGDAVKEARTKVSAALANSRLPFDVLLEELQIPRSATHSPLFQAFINYRHELQEKRTFGSCELEGEKYDVGKTAYDINLDIFDRPGGDTLIVLMAQTALYAHSDAEILMKSYMELLGAFSKNPSMPLGRPSLFSKADVERAIELGQGQTLQSDWPQTLLHRVDEIARKHSKSIALKDGIGNTLTYRQLSERANSIASILLANDVTTVSRVAVFQEPTSDWVCSLLAIFRVGAVYVPLDLRTPLPRLATIVKDCQPHVILAHPATVKDAPALGSKQAKIIDISTLLKPKTAAMVNRARSEGPAVILYTSGSTGTPKGIILKHSNLRNGVEGFLRDRNIGSETVLQQSALSFDFSLWQVFTAIANGGTLYVVPQSKRGDPIALAALIAAESVTLTGATPSEYISWLRYSLPELLQNSGWRYAISGGEPITEAVNDEFRNLGKPDLHLLNMYGPAEVTFASHSMEVLYNQDMGVLGGAMQSVPAGLPMPNYSGYIVDKNMKPVPVGVLGEIVIVGSGIASGYLNNEELTREKFIANVFASAESSSEGWTTMYRTGDRGRLRSDGALIFEGRIDGDTQVKLRGLRIELRDVEATILHAADKVLANAVVSVRGDPQFLVAHVVFSSEEEYSQDDRESFLKRLGSSLPLPQYMCPAMIIPLDRMPMNNHSKLDRRAINALPLPQSPQTDSASSKLTETETQLKQVWERILSKDVANFYTIGAEADFFHVGGNSLLLVRLQAQIQQTFGAVLPLVQLFEASTLGGMASQIDNSWVREMAPIDWESETKFCFDSLPIESVSRVKRPASSPRVVILTGSTGFLGKAILRQLMANANIEKIHCVAMRKDPNRQLLNDFGKVVEHKGDLTLPLLGLSEQDATSVFGEADTIIHNGADVSFLKTYHSLKRPNVESTKELAKMALGRQIPFHFVSTAGVAVLTKEDQFGEVSAASYLPPRDGSNGYTASKWASERYLEQVSEHGDLPVWIHRPSSIIDDGAPDLDIMHNLLKYSRLLKAVPDTDRMAGYFDFISVDRVAEGLVREVVQGSGGPRQPVRYVHASGELVLPVAGLKGFLEEESASEFLALPLSEWTVRAAEMGLDGMVAAYLDTLRDLEDPILFPRLVKG
ncbi:MAG: hypothetical protein Q9217_001179 [Psora testacea]